MLSLLIKMNLESKPLNEYTHLISELIVTKNMSFTKATIMNQEDVENYCNSISVFSRAPFKLALSVLRRCSRDLLLDSDNELATLREENILRKSTKASRLKHQITPGFKYIYHFVSFKLLINREKRKKSPGSA